jgi:hypothetical protein
MTDVIVPLRLTQAEEGEVLWRTSQEFVRRPPGCSEILKSAESARFAAGSESPLREEAAGDVFRGWGASLLGSAETSREDGAGGRFRGWALSLYCPSSRALQTSLMSLRRVLSRHEDAAGLIACNSKSIADYAARIARQNGCALAQCKLNDGGWELAISEEALKRRKRLRRRASSEA